MKYDVFFLTEAPRPSGPAPDTADREAYRRGPSDQPKGGAGSNFNPEFVSRKFNCFQLLFFSLVKTNT